MLLSRNVALFLMKLFAKIFAWVDMMPAMKRLWRLRSRLDWESIYAGWEDEALQYYWRDYPHFTAELVH